MFHKVSDADSRAPTNARCAYHNSPISWLNKVKALGKDFIRDIILFMIFHINDSQLILQEISWCVCSDTIDFENVCDAFLTDFEPFKRTNLISNVQIVINLLKVVVPLNVLHLLLQIHKLLPLVCHLSNLLNSLSFSIFNKDIKFSFSK